MKRKILIGPSTFASSDTTPLDKLIKNEFEVIRNPFGRKLTKEELIGLLPGVQGLIAGLETLNQCVLEQSDLKVISRCGSGIENIDLKAVKKLGIKVFSVPDAPINAVAELTIGAMLSLIRYIPQMNLDLHEKRWDKRTGMQLEGSTVTIIGFGRIGQRVAKLLKPFKARIIAVDPNYHGRVKGVPILSLKETLPQSDIITIHASGNETILGDKEFNLMKKGVFLMNCARGNVIDEAQLIHALGSGQVAGAWLDCFWEEPYNGQLTKYPQVILTPHVGSYTIECRKRMEIEAVNNIIKFFNKT